MSEHNGAPTLRGVKYAPDTAMNVKSSSTDSRAKTITKVVEGWVSVKHVSLGKRKGGDQRRVGFDFVERVPIVPFPGRARVTDWSKGSPECGLLNQGQGPVLVNSLP